MMCEIITGLNLPITEADVLNKAVKICFWIQILLVKSRWCMVSYLINGTCSSTTCFLSSLNPLCLVWDIGWGMLPNFFSQLFDFGHFCH